MSTLKYCLNIFTLLCLLNLTRGESKSSVPYNWTTAIDQFARNSAHQTQMAKLDLYKLKTRAIENVLENSILPDLNKFKMNLTQFLHTQNGTESLQNFQKDDQFVDQQIQKLQEKIRMTQESNVEFIKLLDRVDNQFDSFHEDVQRLFGDQAQHNLLTEQSPAVSGECGGLIDLSLSRITHINQTLNWHESKTCLWIIWTSTHEKIYFDSVKVNGIGSLSLHYITDNMAMTQVAVQNKAFTSHSSMMLLTFSSSGSTQGQSTSFRLRVAPAGFRKPQNLAPVQYLPKIEEAGSRLEFSYPGNGSHYRLNQKRMFVLAPNPDKKISMTLEDLMMTDHHYLGVYTFDNNFNQFVFKKLFSGAFLPSMGEEIVGSLSQPIILYFVVTSTYGETGTGFHISYGES